MKFIGLFACMAVGTAAAIPEEGYARSVSGLRVEMNAGFDAAAWHQPATAQRPGVSRPPIMLLPPPAATLVPSTLHDSGASFGFGLGYDKAVGDSFSVGVDAEISDASTEIHDQSQTNLPGVGPRPPYSVLFGRTLSLGRDLYVGARFTVPVTRRLSTYFKAGYTNVRLKDVETRLAIPMSTSPFGPPITVGTPVSDTSSTTSHVSGFRLGIGGQFSIRKSLFTSLEYRYSSYSNDISRNQLIAGIGLRI